MTQNEALRLALDALEDIGDEWGFTSQRTVPKRKEAITAIKEALAQPEPNYKKALEVWLDKTEWVQETVKPHELGMHRADVLKQRIEEASPQRTWVGLMEDEAMELALEIIARLDLPPTTKMQVEQQFIHALSNPNSLWMLFAAEIEAKLKEKNT
jgi:hypothetical protein